MNGKQVTGQRSEVRGQVSADVCRCQCETCGRKMCTGAAALARDVKAVADETTGANWNTNRERVLALCVQTLEAEKAKEELPLKRAASAAMDFVALVGKLSDEDAVKAIEVMKCGMKVQLLARMNGKAVA